MTLLRCQDRCWPLLLVILALGVGVAQIGAASAVAAGPAPTLLRPAQGEVRDYGGGLRDLIFGSRYAVFDGRVIEVQENGAGSLFGALARHLGIGKKVYDAAKARAKPLRINPGLLLASEKIARVRARDLQQMLPKIERERFKTIAVGIGRDPRGALRLVIGTNNKNGTLPASIRSTVSRSKQTVATGMGEGHAEVQILRWMVAKNWRPITVGAGRPICRPCADAIARSGATAASVLK